MGVVWEAYHKEDPLLGVPEITLDQIIKGSIWSYEASDFIFIQVINVYSIYALLISVMSIDLYQTTD